MYIGAKRQEMLTTINVSADCKTVDLDLKILVATELPATHGTEITYSCSPRHVKIRNVNAACQDGKISFSDGKFTPCFKAGTGYNIVI